MLNDLSIEELIIDDSFANYCYQTNEEDKLFWESYIDLHPSQKETITQAMQMVLAMRIALQGEQEEQETTQLNVIINTTPVIKKILKYATAIAAVFVIILIGKRVLQINSTKQNSIKNVATTIAADNLLFYKTAKGEKKVIVLKDSSKLYLNAASELRIDKDFGTKNRMVYLIGEALFDVRHNKALPFVVHINKYDIKVLGTLFNVKAYPGDLLSETSLIRGKVELTLQSNAQKIILHPNQKAVVSNVGKTMLVNKDEPTRKNLTETVVLIPLSYSIKDHMVIETSWTQNRLEIVNETFADIKQKLERWYNVKITFKDAEVSTYTFSATFEKEKINEVLMLLQNAYPFKFEIKDKEITISK